MNEASLKIQYDGQCIPFIPSETKTIKFDEDSDGFVHIQITELIAPDTVFVFSEQQLTGKSFVFEGNAFVFQYFGEKLEMKDLIFNTPATTKVLFTGGPETLTVSSFSCFGSVVGDPENIVIKQKLNISQLGLSFFSDKVHESESFLDIYLLGRQPVVLFTSDCLCIDSVYFKTNVFSSSIIHFYDEIYFAVAENTLLDPMLLCEIQCETENCTVFFSPQWEMELKMKSKGCIPLTCENEIVLMFNGNKEPFVDFFSLKCNVVKKTFNFGKCHYSILPDAAVLYAIGEPLIPRNRNIEIENDECESYMLHMYSKYIYPFGDDFDDDDESNPNEYFFDAKNMKGKNLAIYGDGKTKVHLLIKENEISNLVIDNVGVVLKTENCEINNFTVTSSKLEFEESQLHVKVFNCNIKAKVPDEIVLKVDVLNIPVFYHKTIKHINLSRIEHINFFFNSTSKIEGVAFMPKFFKFTFSSGFFIIKNELLEKCNFYYTSDDSLEISVKGALQKNAKIMFVPNISLPLIKSLKLSFDESWELKEIQPYTEKIRLFDCKCSLVVQAKSSINSISKIFDIKGAKIEKKVVLNKFCVAKRKEECQSDEYFLFSNNNTVVSFNEYEETEQQCVITLYNNNSILELSRFHGSRILLRSFVPLNVKAFIKLGTVIRQLQVSNLSLSFAASTPYESLSIKTLILDNSYIYMMESISLLTIECTLYAHIKSFAMIWNKLSLNHVMECILFNDFSSAKLNEVYVNDSHVTFGFDDEDYSISNMLFASMKMIHFSNVLTKIRFSIHVSDYLNSIVLPDFEFHGTRPELFFDDSWYDEHLSIAHKCIIMCDVKKTIKVFTSYSYLPSSFLFLSKYELINLTHASFCFYERSSDFMCPPQYARIKFREHPIYLNQMVRKSDHFSVCFVDSNRYNVHQNPIIIHIENPLQTLVISEAKVATIHLIMNANINKVVLSDCSVKIEGNDYHIKTLEKISISKLVAKHVTIDNIVVRSISGFDSTAEEFSTSLITVDDPTMNRISFNNSNIIINRIMSVDLKKNPLITIYAREGIDFIYGRNVAIPNNTVINITLFGREKTLTFDHTWLMYNMLNQTTSYVNIASNNVIFINDKVPTLFNINASMRTRPKRYCIHDDSACPNGYEPIENMKTVFLPDNEDAEFYFFIPHAVIEKQNINCNHYKLISMLNSTVINFINSCGLPQVVELVNINISSKKRIANKLVLKNSLVLNEEIANFLDMDIKSLGSFKYLKAKVGCVINVSSNWSLLIIACNSFELFVDGDSVEFPAYALKSLTFISSTKYLKIQASQGKILLVPDIILNKATVEFTNDLEFSIGVNKGTLYGVNDIVIVKKYPVLMFHQKEFVVLHFISDSICYYSEEWMKGQCPEKSTAIRYFHSTTNLFGTRNLKVYLIGANQSNTFSFISCTSFEEISFISLENRRQNVYINDLEALTLNLQGVNLESKASSYVYDAHVNDSSLIGFEPYFLFIHSLLGLQQVQFSHSVKYCIDVFGLTDITLFNESIVYRDHQASAELNNSNLSIIIKNDLSITVGDSATNSLAQLPNITIDGDANVYLSRKLVNRELKGYSEFTYKSGVCRLWTDASKFPKAISTDKIRSNCTIHANIPLID